MDRVVLQYQLLEKLGAGGMGEIYKAQDTRLNRFVAIKVLPAGMSADPDRRRRFIHEAQAASALNHPNIITIYDIVSDGDMQYMVMEYVVGKTLLELIPKDGLRVPQAIQYAVQMADALTAAHAAGIIHRDLKPANVMVTGSGLVKLLDFGLAKLVDQTVVDDTAKTVTFVEAPLTVEGTMMGTVNYMSPEQAEGRKLDPRSDIFSFGAVLYEMLTGRPAFRGSSTIATLSAVLRDDIQPIAELAPDVPFELDQIVVRCLRKDPDDRFQSMESVKSALAALKRQSDSGALYNRSAVSALPPPPPVKRRASNPLAIAVATFLLVVVAGGGWYWWMTRRQPVSPAQTPSSAPAASQLAEGTLNNASIIEMVQAKVPPSVIVSQIRSSKTNFSLSSTDVIQLTRAGVPPNIIEIMRNPGAEPVPEQPAAAAASAPATPAPRAAVLVDGLPLRLTLAEDVPIDSPAGYALQFKVAEDVRVNDDVVIAKDAAATGAIVDAEKRKILGMGGRMTFRLDSVDAVDGQKVNLRATAGRPADGPSRRPVATGVKKPKELAAAAGTEYTGYVDGATAVSPKK